MRFTCREPGTRGICLRQVEWRMLSAAAASGWAWQWMEEAADDGEEGRQVKDPTARWFGSIICAVSCLRPSVFCPRRLEHGFKEHGVTLVGQAGFPFATDISSVRCLQPDRALSRTDHLTLP